MREWMTIGKMPKRFPSHMTLIVAQQHHRCRRIAAPSVRATSITASRSRTAESNRPSTAAIEFVFEVEVTFHEAAEEKKKRRNTSATHPSNSRAHPILPHFSPGLCPKVKEATHIYRTRTLRARKPDQKVVGFDVAIDEALVVNALNAGDLYGSEARSAFHPPPTWTALATSTAQQLAGTHHLPGQKTNRLDAELSSTHIEEILEVGP